MNFNYKILQIMIILYDIKNAREIKYILMIIDFNEYNVFTRYGASAKSWITNNLTGQIGLFKYPKSGESYGHFSEKLASDIVNAIGLDSAKVDLIEGIIIQKNYKILTLKNIIHLT